jgi:hypothetical protein
MDDLDWLIENGYITKRKHPEEDLFILNYTPKTQYEAFWNSVTEQCRGLIVDSSMNVRSRCFRKFFNYEEVLPHVNKRISKGLGFEVFDKMDGSLGILYWVGDKPFVATRGSFESDQALRATKILHEKYSDARLDKDVSYLFEIIYPENRICVDYKSLEDIIFLSAFETASGKELDIRPDPFRRAEKRNFSLGFDEIKRMDISNKEGFVVRFDDGFRFKIKFQNYVRLHSLMFSLSSRTIWDSLRHNQEVCLDGVPDEVFEWVRSCKQEILNEKNRIIAEASDTFNSISGCDRKSFAERALKTKYAPILFKMFDGKSYDEIVWKIVEPDYKTPRHEEI